jgi:hypothetical protein
MKELEQLDTEIAVLKADIAAIQTERLVASNEVTDAEAVRASLVLAARKDAQATADLQEARRRAIEAKLKLEETQVAVEQTAVQLAELERRRGAAFKSAKVAAYEAETAALIVEAEHLEAALSALLAAKAKFDERLHALDVLGAVAGFNNHQNLKKNLRRSIAHRVDYDSIWLATEAKKLYSMPLHDLVRHVLNNGAVVELKQAS